MYCPECRAEYREGFFLCPDCRVSLVVELPPEPKPEYVEFEEVYSTFNPADIAFLKSYLDSELIEYFFKGEHFTYVRPLVEPARLMVRKDQANEAKELLKDVNLSFMAINIEEEKRPKGLD